MKLFVENNMEEYLVMLKEFEEKKNVDLGFGFIVEIYVLSIFYEFIK